MSEKVEELGLERLKCVPFRWTLKTDAKTIYHFFTPEGKLQPVHKRRSRTGSHGEDCYWESDLKGVLLTIIEIVSNSGKDSTEIIWNQKKIPISVLKSVVNEFKHNPVVLDKLAESLRNNDIEIIESFPPTTTRE